MRHGEDHEIGPRQQRVERRGACNSATPAAAPCGRSSDPDDFMPKRWRAAPPRLPMPPPRRRARSASGRMHDVAAFARHRAPLAAQNWLAADKLAIRAEGEHDAITIAPIWSFVDLAILVDDDPNGRSARVCRTRPAVRLRRLQPAQSVGARQERRRDRPKARSACPIALLGASIVSGAMNLSARAPLGEPAGPLRGSSRSAAAASGRSRQAGPPDIGFTRLRRFARNGHQSCHCDERKRRRNLRPDRTKSLVARPRGDRARHRKMGRVRCRDFRARSFG